MADMQLLCNIFPVVIATNEKIIIWTVFGFEEVECFYYYYFYHTINNIMILYTYTALEWGKITLAE